MSNWVRMPDWSRRKFLSWGNSEQKFAIECQMVDERYHSLHEFSKAPKRQSVVLHDCVDRGEKIAHALHIAKITVVFVVC